MPPVPPARPAVTLLDFLRLIARVFMPGSLPLLLMGAAGGLLLLVWPGRSRRWGARWLFLLFAVYALLSLQLTSDLLNRSLAVDAPLIDGPAAAPGVATVVVLSNGAGFVTIHGDTRWRVNVLSGANAVEGARLYHALGDPLVVASGGRAIGSGDGPPESRALAEALERGGVPPDRVLQDSRSRTTREQALNVGALLRQRGVTRFVLVTVPEHMRRAAGAFRVQGFDPVPSPSALHWGDPPLWHLNFGALRGSAGALHEHAALLFYRVQGWI